MTLVGARVQWRTWANLITLVRTVAAIVLGVVAIGQDSVAMLAIAYGVYWVGDSADGNAARILKQETRFGATFDILSDRANSSLLLVGLLGMHHEFAWPLGIYFCQFMVIDLLLTLSFLYWPLVSPNHFYRVDRTVYTWNWSVPAKTANTTLLILLLLASDQWGLPVWVVSVVAVLQLVVKVVSARRVYGLITELERSEALERVSA
ncbi:CDP-alcohol phosphatidyltransferase family protein [Nocardioides sp. Kera G14]|uniref:CDP-alcohol phosphatidyltransferase family protein n=1 Tax=Nocardioides sp. Kera G14 TaxID=2884264 RepID=UPI001D12620B|nr:CDP-alcohol phosphatidyltransferase family protein [Nocardioides sp. Kera G14]UDY23788.1 CDP-alcohol phosphatidyltransferase family protein [Nocardioides sp. Kera G14]